MNDILAKINDKEKAKKLLDRIRAIKINVLLIGGTGAGKSSTISALFQDYGNGRETQAKVGQTSKPETMDVSAHELGNLVIWDTPGSGDSTEKDQEHQRKIIDLLQRMDDRGQPLIDLIFLVLDGSSRDFSSAYTLIEKVVQTNLHGDDCKRLLIGINKADMALGGEFWNKQESTPDPELIKYLDEQVQIVKDRIKDNTDLDVEPIYFSAGFTHGNQVLKKPYNLQKLLSLILERLPEKKRAAAAEHINKDQANFHSNDGKEDYGQKVEESILSSIAIYVKEVLAEGYDKAKEFVTDPKIIKAGGELLATAVFALFKSITKK